MACTACGAQVPSGARFCPSCGHEQAARNEERRVATVLFADLVGFTTLSETRDPEQVKRLVDRCFQRMTADITAYGGVVDKILGDAIVALFGAPVAHEDDAERAVRAALAMQDTLALVTSTAPVQMRIGVNTGEVVVGSLAGSDYTAMGDVVNTASRLQSAAPPCGVLVGPATYAATRNVIQYQPMGLLEAKGRVAPVDAFLAEAAVLPPGYRQRRHTPLVGRDDELGMLQHAVNTAMERRRGHLILLLGEAGVGKTRLAEELAAVATATHDAIVLEGRCVPYGEANVWWPVAEAIRQAVGITAEPVSDDARTAVHAAVTSVFEAASPQGTVADTDEIDRVTLGLMHLLGHDGPLTEIDPQRAREEAIRSVLAFIEASTVSRSVVVILSDLHWADELVLDMIDNLMDRLGRERFVLVATARHELNTRWSARSGRHNQLVVNLDPLDRDATTLLLDLLVEGDLPREVEDILLDRSGGNPFFLEELVALVGETGSAALAESMAHDDHEVGHLPDTLRGLIAARLDALDNEERHVLADASVWGHSGKTMVLERMAEADRRDDILPALQRLVDKEILLVERDSWSFRSDLVRDVTYSTLTKVDRARAHYGIAHHLEKHGPPPTEADEWLVDVIAHHYAHAAQLVIEVGTMRDVGDDVNERALEWIEEAAARAKGAQVLPVSIRLFTQALALVDDEEPAERTVDLHLSRAQALSDSRLVEEARVDLDRAETMAGDLGYRKGLAGTAYIRGQIAQHVGDLETSIELLGDAAELFAEADDLSGRAHALRNMGLSHLYRSDHVEAEAAISEALAICRELGDRRGEAWSLQQMAWISFIEGKTAEADERLRVAGDTFRDIGDTGGTAWVLGLTAFVRYQQGKLDEARELGDYILLEARDRGDRWAEGMMLLLAAGVRLWSGQTASALPLAEEAVAVFRRISDHFGQTQAITMLGRTLVMMGRTTDGFRALESGPASFGGEAGDHVERFIRTIEAATSLQVGDTRRAAVALGPVEIDALDPFYIGDADRLVSAGLQRLQAGDIEASLEFLEIAWEPTEGVDQSPYAASVLALAVAATGDRGRVCELRNLVDEMPRATYLDRLYVGMASSLLRAAAGDEGAIAELARLVDGVDATGDRVAQAVARIARARALEVLVHPGAAAARSEADERLADLGVNAVGWRCIVDLVLEAPVGDDEASAAAGGSAVP